MVKSKMQQIWDSMQKQYGSDGLCTANAVANVDIISSGSYALDEAMGIWGLPRGRIIQFAGKEASETFVSLMAIKQWQLKHKDNWALFVDAEYSFSDIWAKQLGLDLDRLLLLKENDGAKIFTRLLGVPHKELGKPKAKPGILDLERETPSGLGIIVLDSIASIIPPLSATKAIEDVKIAPLSRLLAEALPKLTSLLAQTGVLFICINQVRVDLGKMFGNPETTPGGKALKHFNSMMINFTKSESKEKQLKDARDEVIGHIATARVDKNKFAPPMRKCEFAINYTKGIIDQHVEIGDLAIKYGVVLRPTNTSYVYGSQKWVGKEIFYSGILEKNLMGEMLAKIKEAKLNNTTILEVKPEETNEEE